MARSISVDVYCPSPDCEFRGSVDANRFVARRAARRCPMCGASPVRIAIPGWTASVSQTTRTLIEARS